jgi:ubiquinone/menaquinone biosynthesis C-methylase UbiE
LAVPKQKSHRWFAAVWDFQTRHEPKKLHKWRCEIVGGATGTVLEIGCGSGANFPLYGDNVTRVIATEPDSAMLKRAQGRAKETNGRIEVRQASAEELPFEDSSFEAVVSTWNMCSVPDYKRALTEVRRVLRPGGQYRFIDHVRYGGGALAAIQDRIVPVWRRCGAGCHPNRDIESAIKDAGLQISEISHVTSVPPVPPVIIVRPCIKGVAIRPAA